MPEPVDRVVKNGSKILSGIATGTPGPPSDTVQVVRSPFDPMTRVIDQVRGSVERLVDSEAFAVSITQLFVLAAIIFAASATIIWLARSTRRGAAH